MIAVELVEQLVAEATAAAPAHRNRAERERYSRERMAPVRAESYPSAVAQLHGAQRAQVERLYADDLMRTTRARLHDALVAASAANEELKPYLDGLRAGQATQEADAAETTRLNDIVAAAR